MFKPIISQCADVKNRLKIRGALRTIYVDAGFLAIRGYFRLTPVGFDSQSAWQQFWDVWEMHKLQLKYEGVSVTKERREWVVHYTPSKEGCIRLDESIEYVR